MSHVIYREIQGVHILILQYILCVSHAIFRGIGCTLTNITTYVHILYVSHAIYRDIGCTLNNITIYIHTLYVTCYRDTNCTLYT